MKDLVFLLITLGLITFAMMAAQSMYRGQETQENQQWQQERYGRVATPSPSPKPGTSAAKDNW